MLKILPIIPSSTSRNITHYSYFILKSLPISPTLFSCFIASSGFCCRYSVNISDTSKMVNESHPYTFS